MLTCSLRELTRPMYSSISLGLLPAAWIRVGDSINVGMGGSVVANVVHSLREWTGTRGASAPHSSAAFADRGSVLAAFDHAQGVAAFAAALAGQFVHERPHQEDAPSAHADLGRIEVGHGGDVEGVALVKEGQLKSVGDDLALDL